MDEFNKTPLNRREYITANDPRDIIDLYGKKTLIDAKKENTQQGIVEYHAIVVATSEHNFPENPTLLRSVLSSIGNLIGDAGSSSILETPGFIIAYIVGPTPIDEKGKLPHDNIPPPCSLIIDAKNLDKQTNSSLNMLAGVGTFFVPAGVPSPRLGDRVRVSFSQMPSVGVMRGGTYIGPLVDSGANGMIDEKILQKCVGTKAGSIVSFISSLDLKGTGKAFTTPNGLTVNLGSDGLYPGTCTNCKPCLDMEAITKNTSNIKVPNVTATSGSAGASESTQTAAAIISMFLPDGASIGSQHRTVSDQQNILKAELQRLAAEIAISHPLEALKIGKALVEYTTSSNPLDPVLYNEKERIAKIIGKEAVKDIGRPGSSGHQNLNDDTKPYSLDISGASLDCIIKAVDLARAEYKDFINITSVLREPVNNAVHVNFRITDNGKLLRSKLQSDKAIATSLIQNNSAEDMAKFLKPTPTPPASTSTTSAATTSPATTYSPATAPAGPVATP
jgi:hypothetical protein